MGQYTDAADAFPQALGVARAARVAAQRTARENYTDVRSRHYHAGTFTPAVEDETRNLRDAAFNAADAAYRRALDDAWTELGKAVTGDPLGEWIIAECGQYKVEAAQVIRLLPASLRDLDALADDQDWCDVWSEFRRRALRAGVISEYAIADERKALHTFANNICCGLSPRQTVELDRLLDEFAAANRQ